jgi:hypothetical protein
MAAKELSKQEASRVLGPVAPEKAFYFYTEVGRPIGKSSRSLAEFADTIDEVDVAVVKFHVDRGDFERWFVMLGDPVLPGQLAGLRRGDGSPAELRGKVSTHVRSRVDNLQKIATSREPREAKRDSSRQPRASKPPASNRRSKS